VVVVVLDLFIPQDGAAQAAAASEEMNLQLPIQVAVVVEMATEAYLLVMVVLES